MATVILKVSGGSGLAADASGQVYSKEAAAVPPEPAVPAAEPEVPPAVPAVGTRDPIDVDYVLPAGLRATFPEAYWQTWCQARSARECDEYDLYATICSPTSGQMFFGERFLCQVFFSKQSKGFRKQFRTCAGKDRRILACIQNVPPPIC